MKRLILLRHAKSDWNAAYDGDHRRPLNRRGRRAAATMGRFLAALGQLPQRVITSTAVRARTTAELAAEAGGWQLPIEETGDLYATGAEGVVRLLAERDGDEESLLLVGHQPTFAELAGLLIAPGGDRTGPASLKLPTAAMVRLDLSIGRWSELAPGCGRLAWLVTPKLLERIGWPE